MSDFHESLGRALERTAGAQGGDVEALTDPFIALRVAADEAESALYSAVKAACPGVHHVVQHRDRKPPWCPTCGRGDDGRIWRATEVLQ